MIKKYSFLIPYHKRDSFQRTLESFKKFYSERTDYEVIIVESKWNFEDAIEKKKLRDIIETFKDIIPLYLYQNTDSGYSCAPAYNLAFSKCCGDFIILTNPESPHTLDILSEFDKIFKQNKDCYIVCACEAIQADGSHYNWYQHSIYNNRKLHFCSSLSRKNWLKTNGFCEEYSMGAAFEDNDFLERVKLLNIPIIVRDDLLVQHIEHDRSYILENLKLEDINRKLYQFIWG